MGSEVKLSKKQMKEVINEIGLTLGGSCPPVRFMHGGCSVNISDGSKTSKGCNVMYQHVYWNFSKETSKKIAKWLGARAVFSE
jgi:hypothetical protein